ncbi:MAG TPA: S9 family peptidase [Bacteroides sp.]|nr:S9 family peptidase [Bacteroides sp.]
MKKILTILAMTSLLACTPKQFDYPETRKDNTVDDYHGTKVEDPYRWLEDDRSDETEAWVKVQNEVTFAYLDQIPYREKVKERITDLINYPKSGVPWKDGEYYFVEKNDGLQNQDVYYIMKSIKDEPEVFMDPNMLSEDGTVAVTSLTLSDDSKYAAYGIARAGSDWKEVFVKEMETGEDLEDHIKWTKFASVAWYGDGFFYSRFEEPGEGEELSGKNLNNKVYFHKIGNSQDQDKMVYWDPGRNDLSYAPIRSKDSKYLILYAFESTSGSAIIACDLSEKNWHFTEILKGFDYNYSPIAVLGDILYLHTDKDAGKYKIAALNLKDSGAGLYDVVSEQEDRVISDAGVSGGKLVVQYMKDAQDYLAVYSTEGDFISDIMLPAPGTVGSLHGDKDDPLLFYSFESFTVPPIILSHNLETGSTGEYYKTEIDFDDSDYETKQVFYTSKDGTKVPMFIVHRKDVELDGKNPLLLYGYGGFNVTEKPYFSASRVIWFENGGIYALANIRGGGEYGEEWHKAGMVLNKQNVFDDFIAAAEYLIDNKFTSANKLAIRGGSNGGLLVGAVINQRPELFKVAFPAVGVMDMLRFHKFTIGYYWTVDYGSSDDPEQFEYLYKYSPLHNIREGLNYPAVMIETADHDDRVVPAHSFKYGATMQEHYKGPNPVLIRIETDAGHGAGKPISKTIELVGDIYSFAFWNLEVEPVY